jgi:Cu+-exporting ATPase
MTAGARREVRAARARIARDLDVPVRVVRGENTVMLTAAEVKPGEQVIVQAGERIGVDGVVGAGEARIAPWLDAEIETTAREGDAVVAGATVVSGRLRLMATWSGADRAWARLVLSPSLRVDVVAKTARLSRLLAERAPLAAGLLAAMAAYATSTAAFEILATAAAVAVASAVVGIARVISLTHARAQLDALSHGIVFKDADAFEAAGRTDVAVLCARGTLLMGEPEIVALEPIGNVSEARLLALAAGAESASSHPFAAAILGAARTRGERPEHVRNATVHPGLGVTALAFSGERLVVGGRALLLRERISVAVAEARISELEAHGRSVLLVALADRLVGLIALQDGLRPGARAAVQRLHEAHVEPVLLSGEARETCETIARGLELDHVRPEVLPGDRGAEVRALADGGHVVAVLGHPSADDSALGAADVAVAMAAAGGSPGEWTIALASDDPQKAAFALALAKQTRDHVRLALAAGLAPPAVALLAIAFGFAPGSIAPVALVLGSFVALACARPTR